MGEPVREALICSAVRTAVGTQGGSLAEVRPDDLARLVVREVVDRVGFDPAKLDDVGLGCCNQAGEDNRNVARMAVLLAGFPVEIPGQTINRLCGSGLQAVASAAHAIKAGEGEAFIGGGTESMTRSPYVMLKSGKPWNRVPPPIADTTVGWRFINKDMNEDWTISLGGTAEVVGEEYGVSREEQDEFAFNSQQKAAAAIAGGVFENEIVPVPLPQRDGSVVEFKVDEHPRKVTMEKLAKLRPAFKKGGTVTAGNSSGINDGAAAVLVLSESAAVDAGIQPLARIVSSAVTGVEPDRMGLGPIASSRKALERAGLKMADMDLIEINEAFAAQAIPCVRDLELDPAKTNVSGGAIALGHPLGATGAKLLTTLVHGLKRTDGHYGLVTMCIGVGQGIAMVVESL
jgi:3-oxoadipyl-CoA thiolase